MSFETYRTAGDVVLASERRVTTRCRHDHDVSHLAPSEVVMEVILVPGSKARVLVPVKVYYSNHCFTRSRSDHDADDDVLFVERLNGGEDERVFCKERWEFSKRLPKLVGGLASAQCFPGHSKEIFYRVQAEPGDRGDAGWYLCGKLGVSAKRNEVTLSIRSVHHRGGRPEGVRGSKVRFWALFADFYRSARKRHAQWLPALEKAKAPR